MYTKRVQEILAKQIRRESEVKGELVRTFCDASTLVLVFADGRFAEYHAHSNYDNVDYVSFTDEATTPYVLGLLTEDELEEHYKLRRE